MAKLHVSTSPITNRIYCGSVNKTDVTGEALAAAAAKPTREAGSA